MSDTRITRRGLFRGLSTTALATGCRPPSNQESSSPASELEISRDHANKIRSVGRELTFELDGTRVRTTAEPRETLLELLRERLGVTGPKRGCDRGACGACMVLVSGRAQNSCMMLAHDVEGQVVTTVAGLAGEDGHGSQLSALQRAFITHDALQCGFCTSGMLVSAAALLRRPGPLSRAHIESALSGNLCRCGSYPHIVSAVLAAAASRGPTSPGDSE